MPGSETDIRSSKAKAYSSVQAEAEGPAPKISITVNLISRALRKESTATSVSEEKDIQFSYFYRKWSSTSPEQISSSQRFFQCHRYPFGKELPAAHPTLTACMVRWVAFVFLSLIKESRYGQVSCDRRHSKVDTARDHKSKSTQEMPAGAGNKWQLNETPPQKP